MIFHKHLLTEVIQNSKQIIKWSLRSAGYSVFLFIINIFRCCLLSDDTYTLARWVLHLIFYSSLTWYNLQIPGKLRYSLMSLKFSGFWVGKVFCHIFGESYKNLFRSGFAILRLTFSLNGLRKIIIKSYLRSSYYTDLRGIQFSIIIHQTVVII